MFYCVLQFYFIVNCLLCFGYLSTLKFCFLGSFVNPKSSRRTEIFEPLLFLSEFKFVTSSFVTFMISKIVIDTRIHLFII